MNKYGHIIAKLRKKQGLTQAQLGQMLNVSYQAVSKWENNLSEPDLETIEKMTSIFKISMAQFFDMVKNPNNIDIEVHKEETKKRNNNLLKTKPWYVVAGLSVLVIVLALCAFLIPVKYSSEKIYSMLDPSVFCITAEGPSAKQAGSGFFINNSGLAVTNYHVIENCSSGKIQLNNGKTYNIKKIVGCDENKDIAIIQIDIKRSKPAKFGDSNKVSVGEIVYAIGYPESFQLGSVNSTFTQGIISKTNYTYKGNNYIQTTVDMTFGNSGGVLVNQQGKVIGITTLMLTDGIVDYMNMAIPINKVKDIKQNINIPLQKYYEMHKTFNFYSDGRIISKQNFVSGNKITPIEDPTKTGYTFDGWYTDLTFEDKFNFDLSVTDQIACYAKWTPNTYTIKFDANGAMGTMNDINATYDIPLTLPTLAFEHSHYRFIHWKLQNGETSYSDGQVVKNLTSENGGTIMLVAVWEKEKYTIRFDGNGADSGIMQNLQLEYDEIINLPSVKFIKTGHLFKGWQSNRKIFQNEEEISKLGGANEVITFTAIWDPITYFIEFHANNGTNELIRQEVKYGQTVKLNENSFTYLSEEKVFENWIFEKGNSTLFFTDQQEISNLTTVNNQTLFFKANWVDFYYIIKYDTNGGEGTFRDEKIVRHSLHYFPYNKPSKKGYTFLHWKYDELTIGNYYRMEDVDFGIDVKPIEIVFVAEYRANTYTINYYESEKTSGQQISYINLLGTQEMTYDVSAVLRDDFTIPGRKINGWYRYERSSADPSLFYGVKLAINKDYQNLTSSGVYSLVADWVGVEFDIVYHNLKGPDDNTTSTVRRKYDETCGPDTAINSLSGGATAHGYVFTGWTFNDTFYSKGRPLYYADDMMVEENGTYHVYANWEDAPTCTINFYANGGEGEMESIIVYTNEKYYLPECLFTREGYTFRFWSINKECDVDNPSYQDFNRYNPNYDISFAIKAGETITLWANWLKIG